MGSRDSEIAAIIKDVTFEVECENIYKSYPVQHIHELFIFDVQETTMDGARYMAGRFGLSLRRRIFSEHLGLTSAEAGQGMSSVSFLMRLPPILRDE